MTESPRPTTRLRAAAAATAVATAGTLAAGIVTLAGGPAGARPTAVPACTSAHLRVGHTHPQGATGHANVILRFRNTGLHRCSLRGYPGVDALTAHGAVIRHARRTLHGFTGGTDAVRTVVLAPGALASADLEWLNFNPVTSGACRFSAAIAVTPANTTHTVRLALSVSACRLQIHPTVAGGSGNG